MKRRSRCDNRRISLQARRPLDEAFVKEMQFRLTQGTYDVWRRRSGERPGEYKRRDYVAGKEEIGASSGDVQELEPLRKFLREQTEKTWEKQIMQTE